MKKLIALLLALTMVFGVAMPVLAADEPTDTQTQITQTDTNEPTDPTDTEQQEIPEAPIEPEVPVEDGERCYYDLLKKRADHGIERIRNHYIGFKILPLTFLLWWYPYWGLGLTLSCYSEIADTMLGVGELLISPIVAAIDYSESKINF